MRALVEVTAIVELRDGSIETLHALPSQIGVVGPDALDVEWTQVAVTQIVTPVDARCDFCSSNRPSFVYDAGDFAVGQLFPGVEEASSGGWLACAECASRIDVDDFETIQTNALSRVPREIRAQARKMLRELHDGFRSHRKGDKRAIA